MPLPRSYLYVPGNAADRLAKAPSRGSDALIVDLEDAVPVAQKDAALEQVLAWLESGPDLDGQEVWVRVNSGDRRETEVRALAGAPGLTGLALAKAEDPDELRAVAALLVECGDASATLMPLVESAAALLSARELASAPRVLRLQIGEVDLTSELGIVPSVDEREVDALRTMVIAASAAAGVVPPMAPVSVETRDMTAFAVSTMRARRQGFIGRACIHPAQVRVVHDTYMPSEKELASAQATVRLADDAARVGNGVVLDENGRLVDAAVLRSARRTIAMAGWGR